MNTANQTLRICSYNIHKGMSTGNLRSVLEEIRHSIRLLDVDLLCLQEVVGETNKKRIAISQPQFEFLADTVWPHHAYGKNAIYQSGHHGNAVLSKNPFIDWNNIDISRWKFSQRGILFGEINIGLSIMCLHFGLLAIERRTQLATLNALIEQQVADDKPIIIAGDFNDWTLGIDRYLKKQLGFSEVYSDFYRKPARTFPSLCPILPMDRIYYRNLNCLDVEVLSGKPWNRLSDHCAIYASFEFNQ